MAWCLLNIFNFQVVIEAARDDIIERILDNELWRGVILADGLNIVRFVNRLSELRWCPVGLCGHRDTVWNYSDRNAQTKGLSSEAIDSRQLIIVGA